MGFLAPTAALIAAGVTVPLLTLLYFLKLRRRQVTVSSTLLWHKAISDLQVNAPFQKLRKNLLLFLQLLLLAGLLLAFARPTVRGTTHPGDRVVIVIDHSASMNATDVSPTRLDKAKELALDLIDNLGAEEAATGTSGGAMVISFAHRAQVVQPLTGDLSLLRKAVDSIRPTDQPSRLETALQLVEPFSMGAATGDSAAAGGLVVYVISDGRVLDTTPLALSGADLRFVKIGQAADNLAIVSLSARRDLEKPQRVQVFSRVANYSPVEVETQLTLTLDDRALSVLPVTVPAMTGDQPGVKPVQFDFTLYATGLLELRHAHEDALAADDATWSVVSPPQTLRVLLVTEGNAFLERVIESVGIEKLVAMHPKKYEDQSPQYLRRGRVGSEELGFDVIIFDGYSPKEPPVVNSLYFSVAPPLDGLKLVPWQEGSAQTQVILQWKRDHPVLRYVALDDVLLVKPGRLVVPDTAEVLATGQTGPVIAAVTAQGVHHVVVSFGLMQSNWPLQISFPVWVSNAVHWLGLGGQTEAGTSYQPGQVAVVPTGGQTQVLSYEGPLTLVANAIGPTKPSSRWVLPVFEKVGVYQATQELPQPWDRLAVNLTDPVESDLRPADQLQVGTSPVDADSEAATIRREIWPWFAAAALAMLMLEWLVYTRRMHL